MKTIIWTRSSEDWNEDRKILKAPKGVELISMPLLRFVPLSPDLAIHIPKFAIVTSQKATHFIARHESWLEEFKQAGTCFLTFGRKTFASLQSMGLKAKRLDAEGGQAFANKILGSEEASSAVFLAADQPAVRIDQILNQQGWVVEFVPLYRSEFADLEDRHQSLLGVPSSQLVICLTSPLAVESFQQMASQNRWPNWQKIAVVAIGPTTAESCEKYWPRYETAEEPTVEELFATALRQIQSSGKKR